MQPERPGNVVNIADREAAGASTIDIYRCDEHGPLQFSRDTPVRPRG